MQWYGRFRRDGSTGRPGLYGIIRPIIPVTGILGLERKQRGDIYILIDFGPVQLLTVLLPAAALPEEHELSLSAG